MFLLGIVADAEAKAKPNPVEDDTTEKASIKDGAFSASETKDKSPTIDSVKSTVCEGAKPVEGCKHDEASPDQLNSQMSLSVDDATETGPGKINQLTQPSCEDVKIDDNASETENFKGTESQEIFIEEPAESHITETFSSSQIQGDVIESQGIESENVIAAERSKEISYDETEKLVSGDAQVEDLSTQDENICVTFENENISQPLSTAEISCLETSQANISLKSNNLQEELVGVEKDLTDFQQTPLVKQAYRQCETEISQEGYAVSELESNQSRVEENAAALTSEYLSVKAKPVVPVLGLRNENLQPFTEEQLKTFYFNPELEKVPVFIDQFIQVI